MLPKFTSFSTQFQHFFFKIYASTVSFDLSYWVKLWKLTAYHKIIQNFEMEEDYLPIPLISHMTIFFHNNDKCTYFQPKIYLRGPKMYLVNNVLENQNWAVPLLYIISRDFVGSIEVLSSSPCGHDGRGLHDHALPLGVSAGGPAQPPAHRELLL